MPVADLIRTLVVTGVATAGPLVSPSELLLEVIPAFELTSGPATDLDFEAFSVVEPGSVAHIDPESEEAAGLTAAIETWSDGSGEQTITVEIVRAIDDEAAATFVDQAAANSIAIGLGAVDPPFGGAWSYSGGLDGTWTNVVAWTQGPYAAVLTHRAPEETARTVVDTAAVEQVEIILDRTGAEVSEDAAVDDEAPTPPTEAPPPGDDESSFPIGSLLVVLVFVGVAVGVMLRQRRRYSGAR